MSTPIVAALVFTIGLVIVANIAFRRARKANELPAEEDPDIRSGGPSDRYMPPPPQRKYHSGGYVKGPAPEVLPRGESRPLRYSDKRRMGLEPHKPSKVKHETRDDRGDLTSTDPYAAFGAGVMFGETFRPDAEYTGPSVFEPAPSSDSFSGGGGDFGGGGSSGGWSDSGSSSSDSSSSSYDSGSSSSSSCD